MAIRDGIMIRIDESALIEPDRLVPPGPWVGHIPFMSWLISTAQPEVFVELGTHSGNSYCGACQAIAWAGLPTRAFAVDTWQGDEHAGTYGESVFEDLRRHHDPRFSAFSTLLRMTFDEAVARFANGSVDLLHIDGLHTYDAVRHDFLSWQPKLSKRAIVLFHDTNVFERDFGVNRLWAELTTQYPSIHFEHCHGLGVLLVGQDQPPDLLALCQAGGENPTGVGFRALFKELGERLQSRLLLAERDLSLASFARQAHESEARIRMLTQLSAERGAQLVTLQEERDRQVEQLQHQLASIENSLYWRVTRPLRLVLGRSPRMKAAMLRALRLFWWAVTLQLVKKIAVRRSADEAVGQADETTAGRQNGRNAIDAGLRASQSRENPAQSADETHARPV